MRGGLLGLLLAGLAALAPAVSVALAPSIDLAIEEAAGGHTLSRHVGQSETALRARLAAQPSIPAASSFASRGEAERVIAAALEANAARIVRWLRGNDGRALLPLTYAAGGPVGISVTRDGDARSAERVRVVLRRDERAERGYVVLTAYPIP